MRDRILERRREGLDVAEAQVQALAGKRVDRVCGVAEQGDARGGVGCGLAEAEGEGGEGVGEEREDGVGGVGRGRGVVQAPRQFGRVGFGVTMLLRGGCGGGCGRGGSWGGEGEHVLEVWLGEAEGGVDEGDEGGGVVGGEGFEAGGVAGRGGPDERGVVVGEREEGDGPAERGEEALVCCCCWNRVRGGGGGGVHGCWVFGRSEFKSCDDAVPVVVPAVGGDAGVGADGAVDTVGADKEARSDS